MNTPIRIGLLIGLCFGLAVPYLLAARNGSGTYSLPNTGSVPNPVVTGTTITSAWANGTLSDLATEMSDSLSRSGKGAMTAPLQLANGTAAAPALTFASDTDTGIYRVGANALGVSIAGQNVCTFNADGGDGLECSIRGRFTGDPGSNNQGVYGVGDGTGAGVEGIGGGTDGIGVKGTGGATNGAGGQFLGNATSGGYGAIGQGYGASYAGGRFLHASTTTGMNRYNGIEVTQDDIAFTSVVAAQPDAGITNRVMAGNVAKVWGYVDLNGASAEILRDGMNITSISCTTNTLTVTIESDFATSYFAAFASTNYSNPSVMALAVDTDVSSASDIAITGVPPGGGNMCDASATISFVIFGNQ